MNCIDSFPNFIDSVGKPTNKQLMNPEMKTFAAKLKSVIKFPYVFDGNPHYWFATHPRLGYWAYNILSTRRIFLRQDTKN